MSRVQVFNLRKREGSAKPWYVRWRVNGRDGARQFRTKAGASAFHARLVVAADASEPFDPVTKLPRSWATDNTDNAPLTCYDAIVGFMAYKWPQWAANSRKAAVETLTQAGVALVRVSPPADLSAQIEAWLRGVGLINPPADAAGLADRCRSDEDRRAHDWLQKNSLVLGDVDLVTAERVLEVFARRRDGEPAAATVLNRKRTQFGGFLKHCVRRDLLRENPLDRSDWKRPITSNEVNTDLLLDPAGAERLLAQIALTGQRAPSLVAFFATIYYAGLRPAEAIALERGDLELPVEGWGQISVRRSAPRTGSRFTDTGDPHDVRGLKWRSATAVRRVPIPPVLVAYLRSHLDRQDGGSNHLVFTNAVGSLLDPARAGKVFAAAKKSIFDPADPLSRLCVYDLRHSHATLLLNAGVSIPEAAKRLGHSPDVLLKVYAGTMTADVEKANERVDSVLRRF